MLDFLLIAVFAFMGVFMAAPLTVPMLGVALFLAWSSRNHEHVNDVETRRWKRWCVVQGIPSLMIAIGGAVAARYRGLLIGELGDWLTCFLLSQLFLAAVGCWWCHAKWRSTLSAALGWGIYSIGASIAAIYSSITHL
jgi:hypothetical protein